MWKMMRLTKRDIVCITRLLQGSIFEQNTFDGCRYCKYRKKCESTQIKKRKMHIDKVRVKLQRITGIYMGYLYNPGSTCKDSEERWKR